MLHLGNEGLRRPLEKSASANTHNEATMKRQ